MADKAAEAGSSDVEISSSTLAKIRALKDKYPWARSAVLPALWAVQDELGYLPPESLALVARELELEPSQVEAVSSFYSMYFSHRPGQHVIQVCRNVSCGLMGSDRLLRHLEERLSIEDGGTTADGLFTLEGTVECLGGCGGAPMMQVDRYSYENLTFEKADRVLSDLREGRQPSGGQGS